MPVNHRRILSLWPRPPGLTLPNSGSFEAAEMGRRSEGKKARDPAYRCGHSSVMSGAVAKIYRSTRSLKTKLVYERLIVIISLKPYRQSDRILMFFEEGQRRV